MVRAKRPSTTSCDRALATPQHSFRWESDRQVQLPGPLIVQPWQLACTQPIRNTGANRVPSQVKVGVKTRQKEACLARSRPHLAR